MSERKYFDVVVRRKRCDYSTIRVLVDVTADMTLQGTRNIAIMKAIDAARNNIKLYRTPWATASYAVRPSDMEEYDAYEVTLCNPARPPNRIVILAIEEIGQTIDPYWKTGKTWDEMSRQHRKKIADTLHWMSELHGIQAFEDPLLRLLAVIARRLETMKADDGLWGAIVALDYGVREAP